ncbi:MAG: tetratricopeptide repeat protein [Gallionellaceae bacterium]|jgi:tetratricopeptide (TPR) repeat protein
MKLFSTLALTFVITAAGTAQAENPVWQSSYQFEAAGKYTEAINVIDPIPANGADAEFKLMRRGWLYYLSGRYDESIREYRYAIERNKKSIDARLGILLPQMAAKRWREAEQNANAALDLSPNNYTALLRLAVIFEAQKNWDEMAQVANTLVSSYPTDSSAYVYLARAKAWQNKTGEAYAAYSAVLVRYPGHLEAQAYVEKK